MSHGLHAGRASPTRWTWRRGWWGASGSPGRSARCWRGAGSRRSRTRGGSSRPTSATTRVPCPGCPRRAGPSSTTCDAVPTSRCSATRVDGVCSTAMLVRTLRALGGDPVWELPSRFDEGYGLSSAMVERIAARGVGLLVTVDCGITAVEAVAVARAASLDVVVTDHHRPGEALPDCILVHPQSGATAVPSSVPPGSSSSSARRSTRRPGGTRGPPRRTSTLLRWPRSATSCPSRTRTGASRARAWPRLPAHASRGCGL